MTFFNIFSKNKVKENKITIVVDDREKNSLVPSELMKHHLVKFEHLPVADYIVGSCAIERKTISDLKSSIINKRIINQLLQLKQYPEQYLIIEGYNPQMYSGIIHENAFRGFILSVGRDFNIPMIFTLNESDTANYISLIARKKPEHERSIRATPIIRSEKQLLQYILEGFPGIGPVNANSLLNHFGSIKNIIQADKTELEKVIGKKSEDIIRIINLNYLQLQ